MPRRMSTEATTNYGYFAMSVQINIVIVVLRILAATSNKQ